MSVFVRDVLQVTKDQRARVIGIHAGQAFLFDLGAAKTKVWSVDYNGLLRSVKRGAVTLVTGHGLNALPDPNASAAAIAAADRRYNLILDMLAAGPIIFDRVERSRLVSRASASHGLDRRTIHASLGMYWRGGLTRDALRPAFRTCGAPGKPRFFKGAQLGRPGPNADQPAPPITEAILKAFEDGTNRYYRANRGNSLSETHRLICDDLATRCVYDEVTGMPTTFVVDEAASVPLPTQRQYIYWYKKQQRARSDAEARSSPASYQMKHRAKLGWAAQDNENAGGRWIIDSTPLDCNLRGRLGRSLFLSTANLYFVVDELTSFITGFAVTFEEASWAAVSLAILNSVEDKVAFCAGFGIQISEDDWPAANYTAMRLLFDKGEAKGELATNFGLKSGIIIENAASFRADLKGICEKRFDLVNIALRGKVPGYRTKRSGQRGERDPRLDTALDLEDAIRIIIHTIRYLNWAEVKTFRRSRSMLEDDVPPIPGEMWNWALSTGRTALRRAGEDDMRVALLPTAEATITDRGLEFRKLCYTCERAERERWFEYVVGPARLRKMTISYHPWLTDVIYVHGNEPGDYEVAVLTPYSQRYCGISFEELKQLGLSDRARSRGMSLDQTLNHAEFANQVTAIVDQARRTRGRKLRPRDLGGARPARAREREIDRDDVRRELGEEAARRQQERDAAAGRTHDRPPTDPEDLGD